MINVDRWFGPWLRVWGCGVSSTHGFGRHHDRPPSDVILSWLRPLSPVVSPPLHPEFMLHICGHASVPLFLQFGRTIVIIAMVAARCFFRQNNSPDLSTKRYLLQPAHSGVGSGRQRWSVIDALGLVQWAQLRHNASSYERQLTSALILAEGIWLLVVSYVILWSSIPALWRNRIWK